jgi:hypothetical protein
MRNVTSDACRRELIEEDVVWAYLIQLLEGLQYLHAAGVAHAGRRQSGNRLPMVQGMT